MNGKGGGKYSVFWVELRALALAVLAVQVCAAESGVASSAAFSYRSLRCRPLQSPSADSNYAGYGAGKASIASGM